MGAWAGGRAGSHLHGGVETLLHSRRGRFSGRGSAAKAHHGAPRCLLGSLHQCSSILHAQAEHRNQHHADFTSPLTRIWKRLRRHYLCCNAQGGADAPLIRVLADGWMCLARQSAAAAPPHGSRQMLSAVDGSSLRYKTTWSGGLTQTVAGARVDGWLAAFICDPALQRLVGR